MTTANEWLARLALIVTPFILLMLLEGGLRFFDYGERFDILIPFKSDARYLAVNPALGQRYFPASQVTPEVALTDAILKEKAAGSYRIFVLGGSTAAGYPYQYNGSFPSILKLILSAHYPNKQIEVMNLAMPAVSSYTVREIALNLAEYEPDMYLIYAGHNEFYGGLGVGSTESLGQSRWIVNAYLALRHYRSFQLFRNVFNRLRAFLLTSSNGSGSRDGTLMARMAGNRSIPYTAPEVALAAGNFRGNMQDIADFCSANGIALFAGSVSSNLRHQSPFVDAFSEAGDQQAWQAHLQVAKEAISKADLQTARSQLQAAIRIDSLAATPYFLQAQLALASGDTTAASPLFLKAKEFDGLRFRASEQINEKLKELAAASPLTYVPVNEQFAAYSPGNIPGDELFLEHLHPNLSGYRLLAETFAQSIAESGLLGPARQGPAVDASWQKQIGVTRVDIAYANIRINFLKKGWPFTDKSPGAKQDVHINNPTPEQTVALRFWRDELTWEQMHVEMARQYEKTGNWLAAAREYQALITATPMNASPYVFMARCLMQMQRPNQALAALKAAMEIEKTAYAAQLAGTIHMAKRQPPAAIPYFKEALQLSPGDRNIMFKLAEAYAFNGELDNGESLLREILAASPNHQKGQELAAFIRSKRKGVDR